jgi:hypothetical protein
VLARPTWLAAPVAVLLSLAAAGCTRDEVTHFSVAKSTEAAPPPMGGPAMPGSSAPPGMAGDVAMPPPPEHGLAWTLPGGWKDERSGGMRYATLKPGVAGHLDGSVVVLPGPAGGELPNVNRWRGQIGLPPLDAAALATARRVVKSKAGPLAVYDFTSEGSKRTRVIAGLVEAGGSTWFVKLTGDADAVAAARADFLKLLESLRLE